MRKQHDRSKLIACCLMLCCLFTACNQDQDSPASQNQTAPELDESVSPDDIASLQQEPEAPSAPLVQTISAHAYPSAADDAGHIDSQMIARLLLEWNNQERQSHDLLPLAEENALQTAALLRAEEAVASLSHTRPDGRPYHTALRDAEFIYEGKWHGENLATIQIPYPEIENEAIAQAIFAEWTASTGHLQNIHSAHFCQTGIGVSLHIKDEKLWIGAAQIFTGE